MNKTDINYSWLAVENWLQLEYEKCNNTDRPFGYGDLSKNLKLPGAYAIYFPKSRLVYIGSTTHLFIERKQHLAQLREGTHQNYQLQDAFDDCDIKAFMYFYIITPNKDEAIAIEQKLIDDYWGNPFLLNRINFNRKENKENRYVNLDKLAEITNIRFENSKLHPNKKIDIVIDNTIHIPTETQDIMIKDENAKPTMGIIMYSDGSARPTNPGKNAWGVHGYLYENEVPKKGAGNPTHIVTSSGYVPKAAKDKDGFNEVKPIHYFDCFGSSLEINSNNVAELDATRNALTKAAEYDVTSVTIYTDSEYVRRGVEEWHHGWIKRNWIRNDGNPVPNKECWKQLLDAFYALKEKGVEVIIKWVKGHNEVLGNVLADKLATIGVMYSIKNILRTEFRISPPEGYWKQDVEKHPFISNKRMYFNTLDTSQISGEYYLGEHGTDDDMLGKKSSDGAYSIVQLGAPDKALEQLRSYQTAIAYDMDSIIMARLDKLYSPDTYQEIMEYGDAAFVRANAYSLDLNCLDTKPLTKELRPARLAMRAVSALTSLKELLLRFQMEETNTGLPDSTIHFQKHDVTDLFYDKEIVIKKKVEEVALKLKPLFVVGFTSLPINIDVTKDDRTYKLDITLTLSLDLPDRNALKRLEGMNPKVYVVTWVEGPSSIRYATIIKTQDAYGIWGSVYSNLIFI